MKKILLQIPWRKVIPILFFLLIIILGIAHWAGWIDLENWIPAQPYN